jgi:hypothetical protein
METVPDYLLDEPYNPDEKPLFYCDGCGERLFDGDEYYELYDSRFCGDCIQGSLKFADKLLEDW